MPGYADDLALTHMLADTADTISMSRFRALNLRVEDKPDFTPVTDADTAVEKALRATLNRTRPRDGVFGEEFGSTDAPAGAGHRRWIIDPIDGTKTFLHGVPFWGTLVALCEGETVLAGAAYFPALDEIVVAAVGAGAWWNGSRCSVSPVRSVSDALVLTTDWRFAATPERRGAWEQLADQARAARTWGDCYGYLLVASGRAEVMVDPVMSAWDAAALQPVITEAGGSFTDWTGRATAFGGSAIATNAAVAVEARELLGAGGRGT
jgi:histidinol-phosphatase